MERLYNRLAGSLQKQEQEGLRKLERIITSAQGNEIKVEGLEKQQSVRWTPPATASLPCVSSVALNVFIGIWKSACQIGWG